MPTWVLEWNKKFKSITIKIKKCKYSIHEINITVKIKDKYSCKWQRMPLKLN